MCLDSPSRCDGFGSYSSSDTLSTGITGDMIWIIPHKPLQLRKNVLCIKTLSYEMWENESKMTFYLKGNLLVIIIKQMKEFMSHSLIQHSDNGIKTQFSPSFLDSRNLTWLSAWLVLGELTVYPSPRAFSVY